MKTHTQAVQKMMFYKNEQELHAYVSQNFGGPANRFVRQEIIKEITGVTIPLVKCGVSHLVAHIMAMPAETINTTSYNDIKNLFVGAELIRKKCGRKGVIKESVDGKLVIELEDGTIRKPSAQRALKLYKYQIQ